MHARAAFESAPGQAARGHGTRNFQGPRCGVWCGIGVGARGGYCAVPKVGEGFRKAEEDTYVEFHYLPTLAMLCPY